jgi:hypothetical protein
MGITPVRPKAGTMFTIARSRTGSAKVAPIQKRRVMSRSSAPDSSSGFDVATFASSAIPQIGQSPG